MKITVKIDQVGITIDEYQPDVIPTIMELEALTTNLKKLVVQMNKAKQKDMDCKED